MSGSSFVAYGDRSGSGKDRYWTFGILTGTSDSLSSIRDSITNITEGEIPETFEWKRITGGKERQANADAVIELVNTVITSVSFGSCRIDVVSWDLHDSRHSIRKRDDTENAGRMLYHLFRNVANRWNVHEWSLFIDKNEGFDIDTLVDVLSRTAISEGLRLQIYQHGDLDSSEEPLMVIPDIFAGMYRWNRQKPELGQRLAEICHGQCNIFGQLKLSRADRQRVPVLDATIQSCRKCGFPLDVKSKGYLWTRDPSQPINFWPYEPQHIEDKAPTKMKHQAESEMVDWPTE